jgi:hypothetical protein
VGIWDGDAPPICMDAKYGAGFHASSVLLVGLEPKGNFHESKTIPFFAGL